MDVRELAAAWTERRAHAEAELRREAESVRLAAERAAELLVRDFGASEVWLFGSLVRGVRHPGFDVDLAVRGVAPERWFTALSRAWDIVGRPVDLVPLDTCAESLRRRIEAEGIRLDA